MRPLVTYIRGTYYASFNELPMIIGEGDTEAEARNDLADKISAILGAVADAQVRLDERSLGEALSELNRAGNAEEDYDNE